MAKRSRKHVVWCVGGRGRKVSHNATSGRIRQLVECYLSDAEVTVGQVKCGVTLGQGDLRKKQLTHFHQLFGAVWFPPLFQTPVAMQCPIWWGALSSVHFRLRLHKLRGPLPEKARYPLITTSAWWRPRLLSSANHVRTRGPTPPQVLAWTWNLHFNK